MAAFIAKQMVGNQLKSVKGIEQLNYANYYIAQGYELIGGPRSCTFNPFKCKSL